MRALRRIMLLAFAIRSATDQGHPLRKHPARRLDLADRAQVRDDRNDQGATDDAFEALHFIARKRLMARWFRKRE